MIRDLMAFFPLSFSVVSLLFLLLRGRRISPLPLTCWEHRERSEFRSISCKENKSCKTLGKEHLTIGQRINAATFVELCQGSNSSPLPDAYSHTAAKSPCLVIIYSMHMRVLCVRKQHIFSRLFVVLPAIKKICICKNDSS